MTNKLQEYLNKIPNKNNITAITSNRWSYYGDNCLYVYGMEEEHLDLSQFPNLERLELWADLKTLNLANCAKLEKLRVPYNNLTNLDFLNTLPNPKSLKEVSIDNYNKKNNIPQSDLTIFSKFINLEYLNISDNNFTGSLQPLKDLNKLEYIDFKNTDIKKGIEYLPLNLVRLSREKTWQGENYASPVINCSDDIDKELKPLKYNLQVWRDTNPAKLVFNSPNFERVGLLDKETQTDLTFRDIERLEVQKLQAQIEQI